MSKVHVHDIAEVLAGLKEERAVRNFLGALLTPPERARIALRWRLVCLLEAGLPQRVIAKKLGISLCKITRGSRELKMRPAFKQIAAACVRPDDRRQMSKKMR